MDEWKCVISALYPLRERAIDNRWRKSWEKVSPSCTGMWIFYSFKTVYLTNNNILGFEFFSGVVKCLLAYFDWSRPKKSKRTFSNLSFPAKEFTPPRISRQFIPNLYTPNKFVNFFLLEFSGDFLMFKFWVWKSYHNKTLNLIEY